MASTDLIFLFFFLPIFLLLYYITGQKYKNYILLGISLFFYACGSIDHFLLLLVSIVCNLVFGWLINRYQDSNVKKKAILVVGIFYNVAILFVYKYCNFIIDNINKGFDKEIAHSNLLLPLGLSFFVFKAISYLIDVYRDVISEKQNPINIALYLSFFAQVQSGPLCRYYDVEDSLKQIKNNDELINDLSSGIYRFVIGFNKKVLLANILAVITNEIFNTQAADMSVSLAWLGSICYSLELFFDFAGYSDMAIGMSRMFGIYCPENFNYPYMTASVSEFWRRWHITLGAWFRDYVYIPLGGSRTGTKKRLILNLFVVWFLTGIWHGAGWNFIFWGIGYFVAITFEKITGIPKQIKSKTVKIIYRICSLLFINFQWVMFRSNGLEAGFQYIKNMFINSNNALADRRALILFNDNIVFIIAAIILAFPIVPFIEKKIKDKKMISMIWDIAYHVLLIVLFTIAIAFVVTGQNNPFAYANF